MDATSFATGMATGIASHGYGYSTMTFKELGIFMTCSLAWLIFVFFTFKFAVDKEEWWSWIPFFIVLFLPFVLMILLG